MTRRSAKRATPKPQAVDSDKRPRGRKTIAICGYEAHRALGLDYPANWGNGITLCGVCYPQAPVKVMTALHTCPKEACGELISVRRSTCLLHRETWV